MYIEPPLSRGGSLSILPFPITLLQEKTAWPSTVRSTPPQAARPETPGGAMARGPPYCGSMPLSPPSTCRMSGFASGAGGWTSALPGNAFPRPSAPGGWTASGAAKWKTGCAIWRRRGCARPPATVFWPSSRASALWRCCTASSRRAIALRGRAALQNSSATGTLSRAERSPTAHAGA